jgi:geranylgeranyl pyrophosphate synthase
LYADSLAENSIMILDYLKQKQALIDQALDESLPPANTRPAVLHEAMRYCVLNGGKRIRPILCFATAELFGADLETVLPAALSLELYHCSTLIHDDLPCMDDDGLRRGLPTCHIKYGAANAILVGDALLVQAFELLAKTNVAVLVQELAKAAGSRGVIAGQVEDLEAENKEPNAEDLDFIHHHKTAILIRAAVRVGALAGMVSDSELTALTRFADQIGLAFQIEDDILDEISTDDVLGKPSGSDAKQHKMTYPAVHGLDQAQATVERLTNLALAELEKIDRNTDRLAQIAQYLVTRTF